MSTRSTTHFLRDGVLEAIVYRHSDGYPEVAGVDLLRFLADLEDQTHDPRFNDPCLLASRFVVWLSTECSSSAAPLDFLSVCVCQEDPGDVEYRYLIYCDQGRHKKPRVECIDVWEDAVVPIPEPACQRWQG